MDSLINFLLPRLAVEIILLLVLPHLIEKRNHLISNESVPKSNFVGYLIILPTTRKFERGTFQRVDQTVHKEVPCNADVVIF